MGVTPTGSIRGTYEERYMGIVMGDKLRQALILNPEEMEHGDDETIMDAHNKFKEEKYSNEFIFKLFQHILIGGPICQHSDNVGEYYDIVKLLYKDLVSVAKDNEANEIKCHSQCFRIDSIDGFKLYTEEEHPQNGFYVLVDPINWHVNLFFNKGGKYW